MAIKTLKTYQESAIDSAVAVFDHARRRLGTSGLDETGRATVGHDNGYLLIEAPTGSGKTPDFIVGISRRPTTDHGLLVDPKYAFETASEFPKMLAEHAAYGKVMIVSHGAGQPWEVAELNPKTNRAQATRTLRLYEAVTA